MLSGEELDPQAGDTISTILSHLNPQQRDTMLAPILKGSAANPTIPTFGEINPDNPVNALQGINTMGLGDLMTPHIKNKLQQALDLKQNITNQKAYSDYANSEFNKMNTDFAKSQSSSNTLAQEQKINALRTQMEDEQRRTNFARMLGTGIASGVGATAGLNFLHKIL
jgi:DNA-binding transcriptional regulator YiaG